MKMLPFDFRIHPFKKLHWYNHLFSIVSVFVALLSVVLFVHKTKYMPKDQHEQNDSLVFPVTSELRNALIGRRQFDEHGKFQHLLPNDIIETFKTEGIVLFRGLLSQEEVNALSSAAQIFTDSSKENIARNTTVFSYVNMHPIYSYSDENMNAFSKVALTSAIPAVVAELIKPRKERDEEIRVVKDIFLAKGNNDTKACGWHVDDPGFWPTQYEDNYAGINAWIPIDDTPSNDIGYGLSVAPGSHKADWRWDIYETLTSLPYMQKYNLTSMDDMIKLVKTNICNLESGSPALHRKVSATAKTFDYKKGDVLIHSRWLFHRTTPKTFDKKDHNSEGGTGLYRRYSIRYELGDTKICREARMENSVLMNPDNAGKTLSEIAATDGPWYPKCWPSIDVSEIEQFQEFAKDKGSRSMELRKDAIKKFFERFAEIKGKNIFDY